MYIFIEQLGWRVLVMLLDEYKQRLEKYSVEELESITARTPISFRKFFNLIATSAKLERLSDDQLAGMRDYLKTTVATSNQNSSSVASDTYSGSQTTDASFSDSDPSSLVEDVSTLSEKARHQLSLLEEDCSKLEGRSDEEEELIDEILDFIDNAHEQIDEASEEPEILYPNSEQDRSHSLMQILAEIKSNQAMIDPILVSQQALSASASSSKDSVQESTATSSRWHDTGFDSDTTQESMSDQGNTSLLAEINQLSEKAEQQLSLLKQDCDKLERANGRQEFVTELKSFMKTAREQIHEASADPEIITPNGDRARYNSLVQIVAQIKSNRTHIQPMIQSQKTVVATPAKSTQSFESTDPNPADDLETYHRFKH